MLYALTTSIATLSGGILPLYTHLRLIEQRYLVAFAGDSMVAIALFDLIPEMQIHNAWALLIGFTSWVFLYVGASNLLPEAHRRFNRSVMLATLAGAALIPTLGAALGL